MGDYPLYVYMYTLQVHIAYIINMLYMHAYILIIGTHFSCGRGPAGPRFVLGSSVLRYTQSLSYVLATKKMYFFKKKFCREGANLRG